MRYGREDRRKKMGCRYHHAIQRKRGEQSMVPDHRTTPWWMRKNSFDAGLKTVWYMRSRSVTFLQHWDLLARHIIDQDASVIFFDHAHMTPKRFAYQFLNQACKETASVRDTRIFRAVDRGKDRG